MLRTFRNEGAPNRYQLPESADNALDDSILEAPLAKRRHL